MSVNVLYTWGDTDSISNKWFRTISRIFLGVAILSLGSNLLITGAKSIATLYGLSEVIIGLTIVSAGTSLPELITSIVASLRGKTDLAIGNVVGSSLLNQLLVLGGCAIFAGNTGIEVEKILIEKDFKCLSPRDEDESDMFPHPKQQ